MPAEGASPRAGSQYSIWKHRILGTGYFADAKFRHDSEPVRAKPALATTPDASRGVNDEPELGPLLVLGEDIATRNAGEAALGGQSELVER
jgi:hypothetical protein